MDYYVGRSVFVDWSVFWSSIVRNFGLWLTMVGLILFVAFIIDILKGTEENSRESRYVLAIRLSVAILGVLIAIFLPPLAEEVYYTVDEAKYFYSIGETGAARVSKNYKPEPDQTCTPSRGWSISTQPLPTNLNRAQIYLLNLGEYKQYKRMNWTFVLEGEQVAFVPLWKVLEIEAVCPP